jgi:hypothetical protein
MKRILIIAAVLAVAAAFLTGCGPEKVKFTATVSEAHENSILVVPAEGSNELNSSDLITAHITDKTKISDENGKKADIENIKAGMTVVITYDGLIAESYPAQITADAVRIMEAVG